MAWILAVARNLALMALRQRERQADLSEEEWDAIPAEGPALSPEERELLQTALAALEEPGAADRGAPRRHWLKHREIAQLLEAASGHGPVQISQSAEKAESTAGRR